MARRHKDPRDRGWAVASGSLPHPGVPERPGWQPYQRGASGRSRPEGSDTYVLDGTAHRFDGTCHDECENVR